MTPGAEGRVPPPLRPFGLLLHHDGSWTHDGQPILNRRLREAFDRGVRFLPGEGVDGEDVFVVSLGRFRAQIDVEEAPFFVRQFDPPTGALTLSDHSTEILDVASLQLSPRDGAFLCSVKRDLAPAGVAARFSHAAQADLLHAVEAEEHDPTLRIRGVRYPLPDLGYWLTILAARVRRQASRQIAMMTAVSST